MSRVVALAGGVFLGGLGQLQFDVALGKPSAQQIELKLGDAFDFRERQRLKEDDVVHAGCGRTEESRESAVTLSDVSWGDFFACSLAFSPMQAADIEVIMMRECS